MQVCTIIAKNYVAFARVLARSLRAHNPEARLWTLIIDDFSRYIDPAEEPFEVLTPADVGCKPFIDMALRYTVLELSTAVKPWLLRHVMQQAGGPVTYLDPDIKVYGSLRHLDELADRHRVVLIPHNSEPIPPDGRKPSQIDVMIAGVYNLGYISLAPGAEVEHLLDWWSDRLRRDCRVDPVWGYFVDQRWFDLAPGFLTDFAIVREPQYNLAYWNLHSRRLEHDGSRYLVDGRPLAFFHFSGFDPAHPLALSRHQDRIDVNHEPVLERLLADYAADVMAEGHAVCRKWPYSYAALGDGTQIDDLVRSLYDEFADEHEQAGGQPPSPFTLEGASSFQAWLRLQAPGVPAGVNRLIAHIYDERRDLQGAFPELTGTDRERLLAWAESRGGAEIPLLAKVGARTNGPGIAGLDPAPRRRTRRPGAEDPSARLRSGPWGVNVVGRFHSGGQFGEVGRALIGALDAARIPSLSVNDPSLAVVGESRDAVAPEQAAFPVNLLCIPPEVLGEFVSQAGEEFLGGRYTVALWPCDAPWPDGSLPVHAVQEAWAPSAYSAELLRELLTAPVNVMPVPVAPEPFRPRSRAELGLPEGKLLFLSRFDASRELAPQNPTGAIDAFRRAQLPSGSAQLVIEIVGAEHDALARAQLRDAADGSSDIQLVETSANPELSGALASACDCYLSLHRAEGFGIAMARAMWLGKPVIATGYSGNLEFMSRENSLLVDYRLVSRGDDDGDRATGQWADPDLEHAASLMRQAFDDPASVRGLGARAAADIRRTHSPTAAAGVIGRRLESIRATGVARDVVGRVRERPPALSQAQAIVAQGPPQVPRGGPLRRLRGFVRKLILRMLKPYTNYQEKVNAELAAALDELGRGIDEIVTDARSQAAIERARLTMELRAGAQPEATADSVQDAEPLPATTADV